MDHKGTSDAPEQDPAEYLLSNSKYHNCHLTVGDPAFGQVERIGVVRVNLVAHSSVFRDLLEDSELADPTGENTHITDVTPEVFKLMLRHVYGGQLPDMSQETAAQLVVCADKYNIQHLATRASQLLTPATPEDMFPALRCVAYISLPQLEQRVTDIVQQHTDRLVKSDQFLDLDDNCVEFIAKQEKLAITELELWRSLVQWAERRSADHTELRQHLNKPLRHVRLLTLTENEILKDVMNSKVLSPVELVDLLSAVTNNQSLTSTGLCTTHEKRSSYAALPTSPVAIKISFENSIIFTSAYYCRYPGKHLMLKDYEEFSNLTIKTKGYELELQSFTCQGIPFIKKGDQVYKFSCNISVCYFTGGFRTQMEHIHIDEHVVFGEDVVIPLKLSNGQFVRLQQNSSYNIKLHINQPHPVFETKYWVRPVCDYIDSTYIERDTQTATIKFKTPLHVKEIHWKY